MVRAINSALESMLGWSGAQVLNFHADIRTAPVDPVRYQEELKALLGPPSAALVQRIREALCLEAGQAPKPACKGIEACLSCIRQSSGIGEAFAYPVQIPLTREPDGLEAEGTCRL